MSPAEGLTRTHCCRLKGNVLISSYRADIDGLRAIAVMAVVLFHLDIALIPGGYAGVDIFFVISGYLIATIIRGELAGGNFSIAGFYFRRCLRILPALLVVIAAVVAVGYWLMDPQSYQDLGRSIRAVGVFSSNIYFYGTDGYFDAPAETKPLLHTWSLAVEEQFYVFFPLVMALICKFGRSRYPLWLSLLWLLSLAYSIVATRLDAGAGFYLLPSRVWELLTGALLAVTRLPAVAPGWRREGLAGLGVALVLGSVALLDESSLFPGPMALLPVAGTALLIYAGQGPGSRSSQWLAARPLVGIGLISYSLYLWHWPVIVFYKFLRAGPLTALDVAIILPLLLLLAWLSWRLIEQPVRRYCRDFPRAAILQVSVAALVVTLLTGVTIRYFEGFPHRYGETAGQELAEWERWGDCEGLVADREQPCALGDAAPARFVVWGDSHARALAPGFDVLARQQHRAGLLLAESGCPPLLGVGFGGTSETDRECRRFNRQALQRIARSEQVQTVFLVSRWALAAHGSRFGAEAGERIVLEDLHAGAGSAANNLAVLSAGLQRTIAALQALGKQVVLVQQVPEVGVDVFRAHFVARVLGREVAGIARVSAREFAQRTASTAALFERLQRDYGTAIVEPAAGLCGELTCAISHADIPLYMDDDHLSPYGAKFIAGALQDNFPR